ncbi:hypothetical protein BH20ACT22_BH20ACT22_09970 [soil metagenome]
MPEQAKRRPSSGVTGAQDFRQEIPAIIQEASAERWVLEEAQAILEAREIKEAWTAALYGVAA